MVLGIAQGILACNDRFVLRSCNTAVISSGVLSACRKAKALGNYAIRLTGYRSQGVKHFDKVGSDTQTLPNDSGDNHKLV